MAVNGAGQSIPDAAALLASLESQFAKQSNNLSDLDSLSTARSNLGLGAAATQSAAQLAADSSFTGAYEPLGGASNARPLRWTSKKTASMKAGTAGRLKYLYFGDSVGGTLAQQMKPQLRNAFGAQAGAMHLGVLGQEVTQNTTSGTITANVGDFDIWPTGATHTLGSAGASMTFGVGGAGTVCDRIYVVHANKGGGFKIQVDGVDNTTPTVTSDGSVTVTTITVTRGAHTVSVVQTSGAPKVVSVGFEDTTVSGVFYLGCALGGLGLNSALAQAWTNWTTVLAAMQPDLLTFEMKEGADNLPASLDSFLTATQAGWPSCDVVLIQSTPQATNDADLVAQNAIIRSKATQYGVLTWDSYTPFKDYATLTALGFNGDGTHVSDACNLVRGTLMYRDLGLFELALYDGRETVAAQLTATSKVQLGTRAAPNGVLAPILSSDVGAYVGRFLNVYSDAAMTAQVARLVAVTGGDPYLQQFVRLGGTAHAGVRGTSDGLLVEMGNDVGFSQSQHWSFIRFRARIGRYQVNTNQSGAVTFNATNGDPIIAALTGNCTSSSISNTYTDGHMLTIGFRQDATGGRTYVWPGNCRFAGGSAPSDTTASTQTTVSFIWDASLTRWCELHRAVAVPTT